MAELADAPDLGSGVPDVQVQVLSSAPKQLVNAVCIYELFVFVVDIFTDVRSSSPVICTKTARKCRLHLRVVCFCGGYLH